MLKVYWQILMRVSLGGNLKAHKFVSKTRQPIPGKEESLGVFLKGLLEAYCTYMPLDPEARENQSAVNLANQLASDICIKLQGNSQKGLQQ